MKRIYPIIISMVMSIVLIGCSATDLKKDDNSDIPTEYVTGVLDSVREDIRVQTMKDGQTVETPYTVFVIEDDFGELLEINFYDIDSLTSQTSEDSGAVEEDGVIDDIAMFEDTPKNSATDAYTGFVPVNKLISGSTVTVGYQHVVQQTETVTTEDFIGVSYNVDYVPLELITGITSYQLMDMTYDWHYQQIHSEITLEGTYQSGGRTMDYSLMDMVTKESDGNVFHSVETVATTIDGEEENRSLVIYVDFPTNMGYYNVNYAQWNLIQLDVPVDTMMDINQSEDSYTQTSYTQEANEYLIEGVSADIEAGYVGQLIKGILSEYAYDPNKLSYKMSSVFDAESNQIIFSEYEVTYDGTLFTGDDTLDLSKFEIMINYIDGNNTGSVVLPDYIQGSINERNKPKFLYEVFFGVEIEELTDEWLQLELSDWCERVVEVEGDIPSFLVYFKDIITTEDIESALTNLSSESSGNMTYDLAIDCVKAYYDDYSLHETGEFVFNVDVTEEDSDDAEEDDNQESEVETNE